MPKNASTGQAHLPEDMAQVLGDLTHTEQYDWYLTSRQAERKPKSFSKGLFCAAVWPGVWGNNQSAGFKA